LLIKKLTLADDVEWTIECNPESFSAEKAELWQSMGVTRLTFGVQSLNDKNCGFWAGRIPPNRRFWQ